MILWMVCNIEIVIHTNFTFLKFCGTCLKENSSLFEGAGVITHRLLVVYQLPIVYWLNL